MNLKAIVTAALVIGSSSLALASPEHQAQGGVQVQSPAQVRDHRTDERPEPRPNYAHPAPVVIVKPQPYRPPVLKLLADDAKLDRKGVDVIRFARPLQLRTITLKGEQGRTTIRQVAIKFANGKQQIVSANKLLTKNGAYSIDLAGNVRNVTGIVIYGQGGLRSSFDVLGA